MIDRSATDRLALLYRLSQAFGSSLDFDTVLNRVMDEVIEATHAERGFLMLVESNGELTFRVARGMDQQTIRAPEFQISRTLVERVAVEGQPILTSDAQQDARFSMRQSVVSMGLRSILCVPLRTKETVSGVIYVDNRHHVGIFTSADLELLVAIASSAAMAIENARLYAMAVDRGRIERELQMARDLQAGLLPAQGPSLPGWEIEARWHPALEVAGDFYDFVQDGQQYPGCLVADVSGKGMPAALFMALSRSLIRASLAGTPSPAEGISRANKLICNEGTSGMFVTLFYARLDPASGAITYVNAGHPPPLVSRAGHAGSGRPVELEPTGMVLGVSEDAPYGEHSLQLQRGDLLFCYTDGVTEALNAELQEFGQDRLAQLVANLAPAGAAACLEGVNRALEAFTGQRAQHDDVTMVAVQRQ